MTGRNRKAAAYTESLSRNSDAGSSLLPFVFAAVYETDDGADYLVIEACQLGDLRGRFQITYVLLKNAVENVVRRKRITIFLSGGAVRPKAAW